MMTFIKWFSLILLACLSWLVGIITMEYFRPYQKVNIHLKK